MKKLDQKNYYHTFSKNAKPAVVVSPGETIVVKTVDSVGNNITTGKDRREFDFLNPDPSILIPLSGPIFVEGAEKDDTLSVDIADVKVAPGWAQGWIGQSGADGTMMSNAAPTLLTPIPDIIKICRIDTAGIHFPLKGREVVVTPKPFPGTIGTCPSIEVRSSALGPFGGNMDSPELIPGSKLYLPVFEEGALLFIGDVHFAQGDGELGGSALEIPSLTTVTIGLIKRKKIDWPRIENSEYIMTVGNTKPLDDCIRIAAVEMVLMLEKEFGFDRWEASMLMSLVSKITINEVANALYSVVCKFPKKYLP